MNPGDDVTVHYEDADHNGVIISTHHGWTLTRITIDPTWDYGSVTARLVPQSLVMTRDEHVKPRQ